VQHSHSLLNNRKARNLADHRYFECLNGPSQYRGSGNAIGLHIRINQKIPVFERLIRIPFYRFGGQTYQVLADQRLHFYAAQLIPQLQEVGVGKA